MASFIESGYTTKVEYEKSLGAPKATPSGGMYTIYYWGATKTFFG